MSCGELTVHSFEVVILAGSPDKLIKRIHKKLPLKRYLIKPLKLFFLISKPKHMLWVLKRTVQ